MNIGELVFIGGAMSIDAFVIAVCKGMDCDYPKPKLYKSILGGLYIGIAQLFMVFMAGLAVDSVEENIILYAHWTAFAFLAIYGCVLLWESFKKSGSSFAAIGALIPVTIMDGFAVSEKTIYGLYYSGDYVKAGIVIGIIACLFPIIGFEIGKLTDEQYSSKIKLAGGAILIIIGIVKIASYYIYI